MVATPSYPTRRFAPVYEVLRNAIDAHTFPGCAFGVFANGQVVLEDALGRFTYDEDSCPVAIETIFDVASLTKVVSTTAAAMLLHQRGLLDVDLPLGELLPGFVVGRSAGSQAHRVTIRHLLAHNSGLPGYVEFFRTVTTPAKLSKSSRESIWLSGPKKKSSSRSTSHTPCSVLQRACGNSFRPLKRTGRSAIVASRARSRMKTHGF